MPTQLPYLASNKNLGVLFSKIQSAKIPDKFNHEFLRTTIGLKGSNDRALIPFLRSLGFIDQAGTPTSAYNLLKSKETAGAAIAAGIKKAYVGLFAADETANLHTGEKLRGLIAQVAGTDDEMTSRITNTFTALVKQGNFSDVTTKSDPEGPKDSEDEVEEKDVGQQKVGKNLRPEFHYNIQIHLPSNATEEVYLNIFNALRKTFQ
jgi:hypothetical protein